MGAKGPGQKPEDAAAAGPGTKSECDLLGILFFYDMNLKCASAQSKSTLAKFMTVWPVAFHFWVARGRGTSVA